MKINEKMAFLGALWIVSLLFAYAVGRSTPPLASMPATSIPTVSEPEPSPNGGEMPEARGSGGARIAGARSTPSGDPVPLSVKDNLFTLSHEEPDSTLFSILRSPDPVVRMRKFGWLLDTLDARGIAKALEAFESLPHGTDRTQEFNLLLYRFAQLDGGEAVEYAGELEQHWMQREALYHILSGWATEDPEAALAWAQAKGDDNPLLLGVINGIAQTDVVWASSLVETLPYGRNRGRAVELVLDTYLQRGVDEMIGWANGLEEVVLQRGVLSRVADRLAGLDPEIYSDWPLSLAEDLQPDAVNAYARQWARSAPEVAVIWAESLEEDNLRDHAAAGILRSWGRRDHESALQWIQQTNTSEATDSVITRFLRWHSRRDPETALVWAQQINNEETRNSEVKRIQGIVERGDIDNGGWPRGR